MWGPTVSDWWLPSQPVDQVNWSTGSPWPTGRVTGGGPSPATSAEGMGRRRDLPTEGHLARTWVRSNEHAAPHLVVAAALPELAGNGTGDERWLRLASGHGDGDAREKWGGDRGA